MTTGHQTRVCTGDAAAQWSRLIADLERHGLLRGPGACDAVARVGADVLERNQQRSADNGDQMLARRSRSRPGR